MWNEYEITLRDAESLRNPEMTDLVVIRRDVAALRDQIKRLGDVNVNAIAPGFFATKQNQALL